MWNEQQIELLKQLWTEGMSAAQIAAQVGGVSRSAVCAKLQRMALKRGRPQPTAKPRIRSGARRRQQFRNNSETEKRTRNQLPNNLGVTSQGAPVDRRPLPKQIVVPPGVKERRGVELSKSQLRAMLAEAVLNTARNTG
jgi:hypothetical protein